MPRFADIRGQNRAHDLLRRAAARERLPHAYLFHGTRGVGKTSTAFALAQFVNCGSPSETDACGACPSCLKYNRLHHPDFHWIFPMAGSEGGVRLKGDARADHVKKTREERLTPGIHGLSYKGSASIAIGRDEDTVVGSVGELRREAGYAPVEARVKVFVITEAERMTQEASNSLLKVLEEPPPQNLLVLTTDRPSGLLDTIVSRCQSVRFRDLSEEEITALLLERVRILRDPRKPKTSESDPPAPEAAALAAALAGGSLTRAADLVTEDIVKARDQAVGFLGLPPGDPRIHETVAELSAGKDRRLLARLIEFGLLWQGDLLRAATGAPVSLANRDREAQVRRQSAATGIVEIRRRTRALEEAKRALEGNGFLPLVLYALVHGMEASAR
jgi:DNA polymerase-3 subunit delta'